MISPFVSDHFRYLSDSVRQDVAKLHDEESSKMEENHKDRWNSASSQGLKYFNKEILQGFLPSWHFLVYVLLGCDGLMGIGCNTFSKLQFQIWSTFACVMELYDMAVIKALLNAWSCTIWVSLQPRWMPGAVWFGMLVHRRSLPRNLSGFPNNLPVPIYTPGPGCSKAD